MTHARNLSIQHIQRLRRLRTVPSGQLPTGPVYQDPTFDTPATVTTIGGTVNIQGKKGTGAGKFLYSLGVPAASTTYTIRYDPDFTQLSNTGKDAMVGFGFRVSGNGAYHLAGLKGDGSTGLDATKVTGTNFNTGAGTVSVQNAADHGTQAGPNYLRLITNSDLTAYTLETSANGSTWTTEIANASLSLTAAEFGIAAYFPATDVGLFTVAITVYTAAADTTGPTISSSASVSVAENATLSHALTASESVTWAIRTAVQNAASLDHDEFELSGSTLRWSSNGTRDYEAPSDTNTNNAYVVVVRATDTAGNVTDQTITVTVTDVSETPYPTVLNSADKHADITLSGSDLIATKSGAGSAWRSVRSTTSHAAGLWYFEVKFGARTSNLIAGIMNSTASLASYAGSDTNGIGLSSIGDYWVNSGSGAGLVGINVNDWVGFEVDLTGNTWRFANVTDAPSSPGWSSAIAIPAGLQGTNEVFAALSMSDQNDTLTANFGASAFVITAVPTGATSWDGSQTG